ncbi:MAG: riboflavin synthase [Micrococcales bacterium]|nr:riboflavin synthase [Micrococcales bacterium]
MFTGLVEAMGTLVKFAQRGSGALLQVQAPMITPELQLGDSVAVNGVCLTVTDLDQGAFSADVMAETLRRTTLGELASGAKVNLERAVRADGRLGGHIVQGHVDGIGQLISRSEGVDWDDLVFGLPSQLARYAASKGSIAIDGVSLTVTSVSDQDFGVSLIPATLNQTTLGNVRAGDKVNLEMDVIAKYVERLLA